MTQCSYGFFSNSCPMILLLVRSHQAEIIIVKRLIQGRNNVTRVRGEPRSCDWDRRKNDVFTLSATLPTKELHYLTRCVALKFENLVTSGRYFFELKGLSLDGLAM